MSCTIEDKSKRSAWGSCVELIRDIKIESKEDMKVITNEMLNTRSGGSRMKPWVIPNSVVGPLVTLEGILDKSSTLDVVEVPKYDLGPKE